MKKILAVAVLGVVWSLTLSSVLGATAVWAAGGQINPQGTVNEAQVVRGDVSQKWADTRGNYLIAVSGYAYTVPQGFWNQVQLGDSVERIGGSWKVVAQYVPALNNS